MFRRFPSLQRAFKNRLVQAVLACAFAVPAVATIGQYWSSGFWWQSSKVALLFWPGQSWDLAVKMPVWASMGTMLASYAVGVAWLLRRRTLSAVVLAALGGLVAANVASAIVNHFTGWKELQVVASMDLAGKANRAIFSLWHNPAWEELVFRGIPLVLLILARRRFPRAASLSLVAYYLVPSVVFALYHVPGHGPCRLVDTFILSVVFAWMALRYTFFAPLVTHYIFDAVMTMSLGKMRNIPTVEVRWLADHAVLLNSAWTIALLAWLASVAGAALIYRYRAGRIASAPAAAAHAG